ncbi:MAG: glycosyltransferase family 2 protein [Roseburia sp.]|nr:glycosyltransferase family 2 protein [Roseburia sp.]
MENEKATVLMCTYNAQNYIAEQLMSLINQTYMNLEIIIYDDFSTDKTIDIIKEFISQHKDKITLKISDKNSGSAKNNFLKAISENREKKYIFFCDQDDVWDLNKVEIMMTKMSQLESIENKPYLVCHNCNVVNQRREILTKKQIKNVDFYHLIFYPEIQGCCMLVNNMAIKKLILKKEFIEMHDWIISLYVALIGDIYVVDEELIDYRQHENNQVGFRKYSIIQRLSFLGDIHRKEEKFIGVLKQLLLVSEMVETEFLNLYKLYYCNGNGLKIVTLFFKYHVIDASLHGIYQAVMIIWAVNAIKKN